MSLFWIPILLLIGTLVPKATEGLGRSVCTAMTMLAPAASLSIIASFAPAIFAGEVITDYIEWIPAIGLTLSMRLNGLALLFAFLILGIGLLVIFY